MKTVSVALVLCLNVGVDPPDVVKTSPCARLECWIGESTNMDAIPNMNAKLTMQQKVCNMMKWILLKYEVPLVFSKGF